MSNAEILQPQTSIFEQNPSWLRLCLVLVFLLGALIRFHEIKAPGHLLDREYTSAIFARAFYFMRNDQVEDWRRDIAVITMKQQPVLEPPLIEYLVSLIYRVMGREAISYARYLTGKCWLVGGIFMYLMTKKLLSTEPALFATFYYLFVPMGVIISRSFQPDSLMMMLFLASLYLLLNCFENRLLFISEHTSRPENLSGRRMFHTVGNSRISNFQSLPDSFAALVLPGALQIIQVLHRLIDRWLLHRVPKRLRKAYSDC